MTVPPESTASLSRSEKQELLRKILVQRIAQARTEPASFAQERLWFLDRLEGGGAGYALPAALRLSGVPDLLALEGALREVVRRHEALRTTFTEVGGTPVQVIAPFTGFILPLEDLSALPAAERDARVAQRIEENATAPFDLAAGPLFRAALLRLAPDEHVLLLCIHHIVSDGWSLGVLFRELSALYAAFRDGAGSPLPEPPLQYADFVARQRERLQGPVLDGLMEWWKGRLAGAPALLELPADHPRPAVQSYRGAGVPVALPADLASRLEALAQAEGATLYMVLLAAFQVLLSRYAGTDDVLVGSPVAGRTRSDEEALIGLFVNTLVVRTDLGGDPAFREVLRRVRAATLGAYDHQEVPFERLVAELQPERSLSHAPLFQVMFALQNDERAPAALAGLEVNRIDSEEESSKFDLAVSLSAGGGIRGTLGYATDLFDRATAERMARHLERVLEQVSADPGVPVSRLRLLGDKEHAQVVWEWSGREADCVADSCIHQLIQAQASRTPDATAVIHRAESLSYRALDERANRLANHLVRRGAGPEARVAICLERSAEMVVAILAVLKAGAAYVPLDPSYPAERLAYMLEDSGAALLVTQASLRGLLLVEGVAVVAVDEDAAALGREEAQAPAPALVPQNAAYVIYTSGSTGRPKGVQVTHGNVAAFFAGMDERVGGSRPGTWLAVTRISFDIHVLELLWTLARGFRVVVQPEVGDATEDESLALQIRRHGVTHLQCTPSLAGMLLAERGAEALRGLERVFLGGEALPADLAARVAAVLPQGGLVNLYGPTETTVWSATHAVGAGERPVPIGRPIVNTRAYVLDASGRPAPAGVPGELYLGGLGVARGYLYRPGLTAERFVPDALGAAAGGRLYRTGDRARWRADGTLEFLGRLDQQVKVRGQRIEPGEIETVLRAHRGVRECVVAARPDGAGAARLVAYVAGGADAGELRAHLRRTLPDYMVPDAIVHLDALPLTPNGKLDRKALPAPEDGPAADAYVAPRTPTEEVLAGIWAEVLRVQRVGVRDNFFALGGHSLLATRVVSRVREVFGVELPLRALFEAPAVAEQAERVDALKRAGLPALPAIGLVERTEALPLSFAQERLWFLDRLEGGGRTYHIPAALRLSGPLDAAALERALGGIVARHDALRTTFAERAGTPVQVIHPVAGCALPVIDISGLSEAEREAEVRRAAASNAARPFDLATGPLFRASLLRLADDEHVLLLCIHHIATDGWSMDLLFRELSALYAAARDGGEAPLAPLPVQYVDYTVWQRAQLDGEVLDRQLAYWTERLAGAPALLELPTDHPRPAVQSYRGAFEQMEFPAELLDRLNALTRREGATLYMVLLGAFQLLLSKYSGSEDVVVGSPVAGRTRRETEGLIGFFANTLVMRTELGGDPAFRQLLRRVRDTTLGAYEHQDVPFERLVEELQPERSLGHSPLFQAMFILQDPGRGEPSLPGVELRRIAAESGTSKFDLMLAAGAHADGLSVALEYSTDLFERATMVRMLGHLRRVLEQAAAAPDARLSEIDLLDDAERALVVRDWNRTAVVHASVAAVHALVEAQAARTPDAEAVVWGAESITYGVLNGRANRLAHRLIALGVGPEVRVGICLRRSPEMIVSVLAVLKAGGAYVPLDPGYPAQRLAFMAADSAVSVLLTQDALRQTVPALDGVQVIAVDADDADGCAENPVHRADGRSQAYVLYTSGSTGTPKGVMMPHGALINLVQWHLVDAELAAPRRTLQFASLSFDVSFQEIAVTLASGGALVLVDDELRRDPNRLVRFIADHRVERLFLPFVALQAIAEAAREGGARLPLREIVTAGEQLVVTPQIAALVRASDGCRLINHYGPTEAHVATAHTLAADDGAWSPLPPIGRPVHNTRMYVLDSGFRPLPAGVPGELFIAGAQVARGYVERPALTAERFIPDPFSPDAGARMYATGDRARWRADGELEYLGRRDAQVKIRGFRVEPGEVEWVLRQLPEVRDCAVVARAAEGGHTRLVAYVVGGADAEALRAHLRRALPEHMVPAAFVAMDRLPLTPSGKLDRRAFPAPDFAGDGDACTAPRTPAEELLAGIWAEVLRIDRVGAYDNFFEVGGHSLVATRVVSRIREVFGVELPLRALFEAPTVAGLAGRVEALRRAGLPALPPVVAVDRSGTLPLSFAQERLWFLDRLEGGSAFYNIPAALRLSGTLDAGVLARALGEIVRRHESLRTTFSEGDGGTAQTIARFAGFGLATEDLSGLEDAEREAALRRRVTDEAERPFDLAAGPLFRGTLLRLADDEHVLLLCMHHVVSDGWSLGVLYRELSILYTAFLAGDPSPLPEPAVQYADYAVWQRAQLSGATLEAELAWWKGRLSGAPALLELPTDHPRPAAQSYRGAGERVQLGADLLGRLQSLARGEGATLYMVLLGAFQLLLSQYSGSRDVVVGSPVAGRTRRETEGLIGLFVNTLVLRTDLSGDPSFRQLLRQVREATLGAYEHQEVPFEKLVEELQPERSLSHSPLFQVLFTLQNDELPAGTLPGLRVQGVDGDLATTKFDLSLTFTADADGLHGALSYSTDLWERDTIRRMLDHLGRVLGQVAADADRPLSRIELAGQAEREQVLRGWNGTAAGFPADLCIHQLFEGQVERTPDAVAVRAEEEALTYAELNERANRLAHHLIGLGVGAESRVAVSLERGVEMMVALLAVLKAGGAYVPLDPGYPLERLAFMLTDSAVAALVTQQKVRGSLPLPRNVPAVVIDREWDAIAAAGSAENPAPAAAGADALAYVIYTSGSTGRPKGVMNAHRGVVNRLCWMQAEFGIGAGDVVLQKTPFSFDVSVWELFWPLQVGATLVMARPGAHGDPEYLQGVIEERGVTTLHFVPSMLQTFVEQADPPRCASLTRVVCSGEALPPALVRRFHERFPASTGLYNLYGPTEAAVDVSCWTCAPGESTEVVQIGSPVWNTQLYVLNGAMSPAPVGVPGELFIGGVQVARGYLRRPSLTAERFVPDPYAAEPGARLYRTGDRARWRADGAVEYLGRLDEQVKIRGFRIELGEIEAALRQHRLVRDCAVVAREDVAGGRRLVAYVVGKAEADALRKHLRRSLPEHMVPSAFVTLDRLPLTPNGKLDRKALPAPEMDGGDARYVAPRTPAEEVVAAIWAEVLAVPRVGALDNFFELGGHSLLATLVMARIRETLGAGLPLRALFECPTLADLAERVETARRAGAPQLPPMVPVPRDGPLPLSFAQERLWFLDRLQPDSAFYNIPSAQHMYGALDVYALERALGTLVRRHEGLRTTFREENNLPVQVVAPFTGFTLPVQDLSSLPADAREAEARRLAEEDAARPFDLVTGPLFRVRLLRLAAEEHVLLLCVHHIVTDWWSLGVFFRELSALYGAFRERRMPTLANLPVQYADYTVWQRTHLRGAALDRQMDYWKERLAGAPGLLELPTDRPRPAMQSFCGAYEMMEVSPALTEQLTALSQREGATVFMVMLGALQVLLGKYSGARDVVVGSSIAGRTHRETEGLVGFFANTLVLRTDLGGDPGFRELLTRVRETTLGAFDHQELPFEKLVAELQPERSLSHSPLFQVMFSLGNTEGMSGAMADLRVQDVSVRPDTAKFDLNLAVAVNARGMQGVLGYSTDLWDAETVRGMIRHMGRLLEQIAADPDVRLSRLSLVDADERRMVVDEWNRTDRPYPADATLHALFDGWVRRTPDAEALVWGDETLSYRALDERANRLANHLVRLGVGPESRVGVLLERGVELIVSILAVIKAGGCYVPLDPTYPAGRLELMLADAGIRVLLSEAAIAERLDIAAVHVVRLDHAAQALASESAEAPESGATAGNLAYIVYTSGSTGRPKGVMVGHRETVQLVVETDYVRFAPGDRIAQASNASFDALTFEMWGAFLNGATLVGIPRDVLLSPPALRETLRRERITTLYQTTALLNQLSREQPDIFAPLREVLFGGQASDADRVRALLRSGKPQRLLHVYGPTETTAWCSWENVEHVDEDALTVSVGRPTGNSRIYVLDAALQPAPVGVPGEAYVGGGGIVRGYLDRPALTAERFVPDPFAAKPGARMYRTGDRLRWKADGTLEFAGRLDAQVKIRGFRIEPGEVESALSSHADVREARVIVRDDEPGEHRLVAYTVGEAGADALREHLRRTLPEYMVPAAFVALERLPLTPNGKLDIRALPAPELAGADDRYVAPRTPAEEVLAGIWAEVLRAERIGVHDAFFEIGGHSLLATQVVSRIRQAFGVELPLRALFEGPTVAELAERIEALRRAGGIVLPPVVPLERTGPLPLSFAQERLWFLDRLQPDGALYNIPLAIRLTGALHRAALEHAFNEVVRRHESLRTVFAEADGAPVQVIHPFRPFELPVTDLSGMAEAEREAEVRRRAEQSAAQPFDLAAGPLLRAALLRLAAEEHVLLLCMHHVVSDGWSVGVLFRELGALYAAHRDGTEPALSPLPVQYADYAAWQREQLRGEALERQLSYWRERMEGAPALLELPVDHPRPAVQTYRGASEWMEFPAELAERLNALARREGATLYMVLLGAFQLLLSKYSGSDDVVVGSPVAGRTRRETEDLIGFFVNTLVLRTELAGDPAFAEVLRRVRETTLGAWEHQEVPFERLVEELQPERSLSHSPLFQVMFTLASTDGYRGGLPGLRSEGIAAGLDTTKFDLNLVFGQDGGGLQAVLQYNADLFEPGTMVRMLAHLGRVLEQVAARAELPVSAVELMDPAERDRVLAEWNATASCAPAHLVHHLVAEQAARAPHAPALLHGPERMEYAELDRRAEALARRLRALGVGPEVPVGLCMDRTPELLVGVLGIWKAGGAYVPLDPDYPAERLSWIVADASLATIVTAGRAADSLPAHHAALVRVDAHADAEDVAHPPVDAPVSASSLAYVIYTSGSTGRPKGVLVQHGSLANLLATTRDAFGVHAGDVMPALASCAFDIWLFEALLPLVSGAAVRLVDREHVLNVPALLDEVADATLLHAVPALMREVAQVEAERPRLGRLRRAFVGGDRVPADLLAEMGHALPDAETHVLYGPTEGTILASALPVGNEAVEGHPIGRPLGNVRLYVCDARGGAQPQGIAGELLIGGAGVARGYLGQRAMTAERFVPDPFSTVPGARLYRTGDRARWKTDGTLEYLGRLDGQVKIRGFRIEPAEVEAALRRCPGVRECVVVAREDGAGGPRLVAYAEGSVDAEALRAQLRQALPEHMVPAAFVVLDALTVTPNGKLDRRALPAPEQAAGAAAVAPRDALEARVAEVWREVLGAAEIGVHDNFFEIGGTSLLLYRVFSRLREVRGDLRVVDLFRYTSVEALAAYLGASAPRDTTHLDEGRARAEERRNARRRVRG